MLDNAGGTLAVYMFEEFEQASCFLDNADLEQGNIRGDAIAKIVIDLSERN
tara:strand:+ start:4759 stop:4911 length:153 start_codon:yes stop_codon:yes gene_type:complete